MSPRPCPYCGSDAPHAYRAADFNKKMSDESFDYYRCPKDGFVFLAPVPGDLGKYYPESYYEVPRDEAEMLRLAESLQQWKLDTVLEFRKPGRLLEIGAAYGLFSFLAKRAGFEVTAIEMDARCCQILRENVGIEAIETDDIAGAFQGLGQFDVIVMWQVIEHLPDPWTILTEAARHLAPGGVLILDTPNPDAFQFRVLGRRWAHLDAPRHVCLIPAEMMTEHLSREGLAAERLTAADASAIGFNGFGWAFSFKHFFGDNPVGRAAHLFGRLLAKILIPIERTGWRGSTYTAAYRRPA